MKQKSSQPKDQERREFITKSTLLSAGVVATTLASTAVIAGVDEPATEAPKQKGYQLTQHVIDYYQSAKI